MERMEYFHFTLLCDQVRKLFFSHTNYKSMKRITFVKVSEAFEIQITFLYSTCMHVHIYKYFYIYKNVYVHTYV